jgi:uncharacterized RDD family membrane protein YckC
MTVTSFLGIFILPAFVFALTYAPLVRHLTRSVLTPYPKADVRRRLFAAAVDGLLVAMTFLMYRNSGFVGWLAGGAVYLLFRDAVRGQSLGKVFMGLTVIDLAAGRPATFAGSFRRNALLVLPGANVVAIFLEAKTIVMDPQGQRLGDRLALTQVVEGLGARDLVRAFQEWLRSLGGGLGRSARRPGYRPAEADRRSRRAA